MKKIKWHKFIIVALFIWSCNKLYQMTNINFEL